MVADAGPPLSVGTPMIAASSVQDAVRNGIAGVSPVKRGRPSKVPTVLTDAAGSWARVGQVGGDEKANTRPGQQMMAATLGTIMEGAFSLRAAKKQLKKRQRLSTTASSIQDGRRFAWEANGNLNGWFSGWKTFFVDSLFGTPEPTTPPGSSSPGCRSPPPSRRKWTSCTRTFRCAPRLTLTPSRLKGSPST